MQPAVLSKSPKTLFLFALLLIIFYLLFVNLMTQQPVVETDVIETDTIADDDHLDSGTVGDTAVAVLADDPASSAVSTRAATDREANVNANLAQKNEAAIFELDQKIAAQNTRFTELIAAYDQALFDEDKQLELSRALADSDYKANMLQKFKLEISVIGDE